MPPTRLSVRSREQLVRGVLWALAVLAALGAVPEAPAMTAHESVDALWVAAAAAVFVAAGSSSRRSAWLVASVLVASAAGAGPALVLAGAALLLGVAAALLDRRDPIVGGIVGALLVNAAVRLPPGPLRGLPAVVAVAALCWLTVSAVRLARPRTRRIVRVVAIGVGLVALGATLGLLAAGGSALRSVDAASGELRASVQAASSDDRALADHLAEADRELHRAREAVTGPLTRIADVVPLLGRQSAAMREVTAIGVDLGASGTAVAEVADYRRLALEDQRVDVGAVADMEGPLREVLDGLHRADGSLGGVDTSWLVAPLDERIRRLHREVRDAIPSTELAIEVVAVAPALLGGEGTRHYLLAFTQPSEARGLGGFMGNWAELEVAGGRIELAETGRAVDLNLAPGFEDRILRGPDDYVERYGPLRIERFLQDVTFSPDMPSVGAVFADQYEQITGTSIDGVVVIDPVALAALLEITGPIRLPQRDEPLDADSAADYLLSGQYLEVDDRGERIDALEEASRRAFDRLLGRRVLEPARMGRVLGPPVQEGRLLAWARRAEEQAVIERLGLDGAFVVPEGGELLSVVSQNSGNNKIDYYLHRTVDQDLTWDPGTGTITGTVRVTLRNEAPASGLPRTVIGNREDLTVPDGDNVQILTIYTATVGTAMRVDGVAVPVTVGLERGARAYSTDLVIPAGATRVVELDVEGSVTPGPELVLRWDAQPLVHPDRLRTTVAVAAPWRLDVDTWSREDARDVTTSFIADRVPGG